MAGGGAIATQFLLDRRLHLSNGIGSNQDGQCRPAEFRIHNQALNWWLIGEDGGEKCDAVLRLPGPCQRFHKGQLVVGTGSGRARAVKQGVDKQFSAGSLSPIRIGVAGQCLAGLCQNQLQHTNLGFCGSTLGYQGQEVACPHFTVSGHLPRR